MKQTLCCLLQNRLGALDRVLGALTHRGFLPEHFVSMFDTANDCLKVMMTFDCEDEKQLEKLMNFLDKQVYVLEVRDMARPESPEARPQEEAGVFENVAALFTPVTVGRKIPHVHHA
jgi:acetolactate synthase small subunit